MKRFIITVMFILLAGCSSMAPQVRFDTTMPDRIAKAEDQARQNLRTLLDTNSSDERRKLLSNNLLCGPGLWQDLEGNRYLTGHDLLPMQVELQVETIFGTRTKKMDGQILQSSKAVYSFWLAMLEQKQLRNCPIRKPSPDELKRYWASSQAKEPIFVIDSPSGTILVDFNQDSSGRWIPFAVENISNIK